MNDLTQGRVSAGVPGMALMLEDYKLASAAGPVEKVAAFFDSGFFESGYATERGGIICVPPDAIAALTSLLWRYEQKHGHRPTVAKLIGWCDTLREVG